MLYIAKLLYILIKARNYWFIIYLDHYKEKQKIKMLSYNIYLYITKSKNKNFNIIRFYIKNIFNIRLEIFVNNNKKIIKVKFKTKSETIFKTNWLINWKLAI